MTPQEIIQRARGHFGEANELTLLDVTVQEWVNDAMKELYDVLHATRRPEELRTLLTTDTVSLTSGQAALDEEWDELVSVKSGEHELARVTPAMIRHIDSNQFFQPTQTVWTERENTLYVRPTSVASVQVVHLEPPARLVFPGALTTEIEAFSPRWHIALVWLVTSYAYAQEEDLAQANHYRGRFADLLGVQPTGAAG